MCRVPGMHLCVLHFRAAPLLRHPLTTNMRRTTTTTFCARRGAAMNKCASHTLSTTNHTHTRHAHSHHDDRPTLCALRIPTRAAAQKRATFKWIYHTFMYIHITHTQTTAHCIIYCARLLVHGNAAFVCKHARRCCLVRTSICASNRAREDACAHARAPQHRWARTTAVYYVGYYA